MQREAVLFDRLKNPWQADKPWLYIDQMVHGCTWHNDTTTSPEYLLNRKGVKGTDVKWSMCHSRDTVEILEAWSNRESLWFTSKWHLYIKRVRKHAPAWDIAVRRLGHEVLLLESGTCLHSQCPSWHKNLAPKSETKRWLRCSWASSHPSLDHFEPNIFNLTSQFHHLQHLQIKNPIRRIQRHLLSEIAPVGCEEVAPSDGGSNPMRASNGRKNMAKGHVVLPNLIKSSAFCFEWRRPRIYKWN